MVLNELLNATKLINALAPTLIAVIFIYRINKK